MVVRHPAVVARVAPGALSDHGRLAALVARFWDYTRLLGSADLERLWSARADLSFGWRVVGKNRVCAETAPRHEEQEDRMT